MTTAEYLLQEIAARGLTVPGKQRERLLRAFKQDVRNHGQRVAREFLTLALDVETSKRPGDVDFEYEPMFRDAEIDLNTAQSAELDALYTQEFGGES